MKRIGRLLTLALFLSVLLVLPRPAREVLAQAGRYQTCITSFFTEPGTPACADCCVNYSSAGTVDAIDTTDDTPPGDQSASLLCRGYQRRHG
jgi:hypothetical protein